VNIAGLPSRLVAEAERDDVVHLSGRGKTSRHFTFTVEVAATVPVVLTEHDEHHWHPFTGEAPVTDAVKKILDACTVAWTRRCGGPSPRTTGGVHDEHRGAAAWRRVGRSDGAAGPGPRGDTQHLLDRQAAGVGEGLRDAGGHPLAHGQPRPGPHGGARNTTATIRVTPSLSVSHRS
jgi:hypothetical protein